MKRWTLRFLLVAVWTALGSFYFMRTKEPRTTASKTTFINETGDHRHDKALKGSIKIARKRAGIDYAIVMLKNMPANKSIEDLAVEYFQKYQIGAAARGKGVLFLFVEDARQLKIEVSYELEGIFPDISCSHLEQGARSFMLTGNRRDFLTELLVTMSIHYIRTLNGDKNLGMLEFPYEPGHDSLTRFLSGGAGVVGRGYAATLEAVNLEVRSLASMPNNNYLPSKDPEETVKRYLASLEAGIGDSKLPLLTEGSQYYRIEMPRSSGYQRRNYNYYQWAMPYKIYKQNDLGVAMFKEGRPIWPILLRKTNKGLWLVDEAKSWAYFHLFENSENAFPKYPNHAFHFAWTQSQSVMAGKFLYKNRSTVPDIQSYPYRLSEKILALELEVKNNPTKADLYFQLGDLLYFEAYWLSAAIPLYETGLKLDPTNLNYRWRLVDLYQNDTRVEEYLNQLETISKMQPHDAEIRRELNSAKQFYNGENK